jgi:hypothetical protein
MKNLFAFTQFGFIVLTVICYALLLVWLNQALRESDFTEKKKRNIFRGTLAGLVFWLIVTAILAAAGILSDFSSLPPRFFMVLIVPLIVIILIARTDSLKEILRHVAPEKLIYLQSFRIFVEILLWMLYLEQKLPIQMTFEGRNFDVLAGLTAVVVAFLLQRKIIGKRFIYVWNIFSLILLTNIVTIAILSTPVPFRVFMNEPANTIVTTFPFVWLPALLVPMAYGLNVLSFVQWRSRDSF